MPAVEDITSKKYLSRSLENAKSWCSCNLSKYLGSSLDTFDYSIFHYVIDNELLLHDMRLDERTPGLIRVSTEKIKWYQEREEHYSKDELYSKIREAVEVDPESMFVHEIVEWIILNKLGLLNMPGYIVRFVSFHAIASKMENINRKERDLREWRDY